VGSAVATVGLQFIRIRGGGWGHFASRQAPVPAGQTGWGMVQLPSQDRLPERPDRPNVWRPDLDPASHWTICPLTLLFAPDCHCRLLESLSGRHLLRYGRGIPPWSVRPIVSPVPWSGCLVKVPDHARHHARLAAAGYFLLVVERDAMARALDAKPRLEPWKCRARGLRAQRWN